MELYHQKLDHLHGTVHAANSADMEPCLIAAFEMSFEALQREHEQTANLLVTSAFLDNNDIWHELIHRSLYGGLYHNQYSASSIKI